jgi:hypothetical protein
MVELAVSATLLVGVLAGTNAMVSASSDLSRSTTDEGTASARSDRALQLLSTAIRRGSLATLQHLDDSAFVDGETDTGFKIQENVGYNGDAVLDTVATYWFELPTGKIEGSIKVTQDGFTRVLATGVTAFSVRRTGTLLTFDVSTRSGPTDARERTSHAIVRVATRNP